MDKIEDVLATEVKITKTDEDYKVEIKYEDGDTRVLEYKKEDYGSKNWLHDKAYSDTMMFMLQWRKRYKVDN
jgi:hypothetical protein